eukprot:5566227-Heterocapsa_arctica.AAC.1
MPTGGRSSRRHPEIEALPLNRSDEEAWEHHTQVLIQKHEASVRELREKGFRSVRLGSAPTQGDGAEE